MSLDKALSPSSILTLQSSGAIVAPTATADKLKAKQAAKDFEAVFITEMMKPMFESIEVDDTFGGGKGEEVFRGLLTQEYGKMFSQKGGIGLAAHVQSELIKIQEHATIQPSSQGGVK
ncbi:MAG: rod-binding protein [Pseudomonadota bacterium]